MKVSYKNHKKHEMYPDGRIKEEKVKEFKASLNPTFLSQLLKRVQAFFKSQFPF